MASAQVLSTTRKQEHLEAGKRRLEEFRKKKAAERAKKSTSVSHSQVSDVGLRENLGSEADRVRLTDSGGVGSSDRPDKVFGPTPLLNNEEDANQLTKLSTQNQQSSSNITHAYYPPSLESDLNSSFKDLAQTYSNNQAIKVFGASGSVEQAGASANSESKNVSNDIVRGQDRSRFGSLSDQLYLRLQENQDYDTGSSKSNFQGTEEPRLKVNNNFSFLSGVKSDSSDKYVTQAYPLNSITPPLESKLSTVSSLDNGRMFYPSSKDSEETKLSTHAGSSSLYGGPAQTSNGFPSLYDGLVQTSKSSGFGYDINSSYNHMAKHSSSNEFPSRRSRSSFLDSLDIPKTSSGSPFQRTEPQKESFMSTSIDINSKDLQSSALQKPLPETGTKLSFPTVVIPDASSQLSDVGNYSGSINNGAESLRPDTNEKNNEMNHGFYSTKQNEDFAALEQHIEDLTQEKFQLQRSLEASQALAQSLAAENSSLTDSYNQQRSVVNQLKSDMEKLQEEIKAQLAELESFKDEYANVRLECNAADERAKILASEVIGLEEKALRLRSNELRLERQLENSQAEISSYKKKVSSLEKERQDLQLTVDAFQEEKKMLQSKMRKAGSMQFIETNKNASNNRKDMSTSTEDLDPTPDNNEMHCNSSSIEIDASGLPLLPGNGLLSLDVSAASVPPDQARVIQNINELISELSLEKEELVQALSTELSQSSKLKDLNNELSRKLEAQTQRLELLTAQSMATENVSIRQSDSRIIHDNNVAYPDADEGDEVVERVLGWIMKLFPGGPSRRRTSKLL